MTDPDKPDFQVVDRRRSAQPSAPTAAESTSSETMPSSDSSADVPADTSSLNPNTNPAQTQEPAAPGTQTSASSPASELPPTTETDNSEPAQDDMPMPDPGALLAYVAMQMDVKTLAGALLGVFSGHAWRAMGLVANPVTGQTEKNLPEAQIAIDCVQFLLGKLDADLSAEERREIQRRLNDLRVNYLAKMRES